MTSRAKKKKIDNSMSQVVTCMCIACDMLRRHTPMVWVFPPKALTPVVDSGRSVW